MSGALSMMLACAATSGLTLIGSASNDALATTLTINKPSGVSPGDLMIAVVGCASSLSWTGDSGWTEVADHGSAQGLRVAWKVAGASEPSSYTFTGSSSSRQDGFIIAYRGAAFDVVGSFGTATSGSDVTVPGVTLSADGILLAVFCSNWAAHTFSTPTDMIPVLSQSAANPSYALFSQQVSAGATGSRTSSPSGGSNTGILIGIKGA